MYMKLATKVNRDNCADIRTDDVKAFIKANRNSLYVYIHICRYMPRPLGMKAGESFFF